MNTSLQEKKNILRREMKEKALGLNMEYRREASRDICRQIIESSEFQRAKNVFLFVGVQNEPDTSEIISFALDHGKTVALPLCYKGGVMEARIISSMDELKAGMFGILEPSEDSKIMEPQDIDYVLMPCVAASFDGKRLGHGMGYYDRFLENQKAYKTILCLDMFMLEEIPVDRFDILADRVITNKK